MQLRSGKTNIPDTINMDQYDIHYKSFKEIYDALRYNFRILDALELTSLKRIRVFNTIFQLVQSKIVEINYLNEHSIHPNIKKFYVTIRNKIPELIKSISNIMYIDLIDLDDRQIEDMTSCLGLLMKLRKHFK